ncbi:PREDICTED: protein TIFY 8 isoform X1 [Camelina sativa]|uniref:Protein TIFY n=1 Tax=Camelina sativa TaxID=90675 RepID=A0ABM0U9G1_CAMSA|nr:PREDICTED: protein TIFY 8 isoform X1 [Camelina sativa]
MMMKKNHKSGERTTDVVDSRLRQKEQDKLLFHDFLGSKTPTLASPSMADHRLPQDNKPSMTPSSSAGGRGGLSSTSDLVQRHSSGGNHLDGIQLFGPRSEVSGSIMSNRFSGNKRSNSDSHFSTQENPENLHWSKLLRNGPGSFSMNVNPLANQPPRGGGQISHLLHQLSTSRFKDENVGPSVIVQTAADEGSRTGMKGPSILSPFTMPNRSKLESFAPSSTESRKNVTSSTKQMTIFYGGQAHVFDDVQPNKADVIMALAGSSGGSWSTGLSHKPKSKNNTSDGPYKVGQMYEGGSSRGTPLLAPEFRARPSHQATSSACQRIFTQQGREHQGSIISRGRDTRDPVHISDPEKEAT